jgi:hypothetical protein
VDGAHDEEPGEHPCGGEGVVERPAFGDSLAARLSEGDGLDDLRVDDDEVDVVVLTGSEGPWSSSGHLPNCRDGCALVNRIPQGSSVRDEVSPTCAAILGTS